MVLGIFSSKKSESEKPLKSVKRKWDNSHIALGGAELMKRQAPKLEDIESSLSVSSEIYEQFYKPLFINICELAQCVPASESDHHSNEYGYLDHVFECVVLALRKSEGVIYGSEREDKIMRKRDVFTYAVTVGAITHDLGKLVTDIEFHDATNNKSHCAVFGALKPGTEFIYRFYPNRNYSDHRAASGVALQHVLPEKGLKWLYEDEDLFRQLIHTMSGDYKLAGKLGEIVREADKFSTQKNLGRTATKFASRISHSSPVSQNSNDMALQDAQQQQAQSNKINRATDIANAVIEILHRHQDYANGKDINEKGGYMWVTRDYIYMVTPRGFELIKSVMSEKGVGNRIAIAHVCYSVLFDGGFIEKINGQTSDFLTVDPDNWNKAMRFVKFKREKLDPEFRLSETKLKIVNPKEQTKTDDKDGENDKKEQSATVKSETPKTVNIDSKNDVQKSPQTKQVEKVVDGNKEQSLTEPVKKTETIQSSEPPPPGFDDLPPEAFVTGEQVTNNHADLLQADEAEVAFLNEKRESALHKDINQVGQLFLEFLKDGMSQKRLSVNKINAPVHFVDGKICLVSPNIFKLFINTDFGERALALLKVHDSVSPNKKVKALQFEIFDCGLHHKDVFSKNIIEFSVVGAQKHTNVNGVLLKADTVPLITDDSFTNSRNVHIKSKLAPA